MRYLVDKRILVIFLLLLVLVFIKSPAVLAQDNLAIKAEAAILVDGDTGKILYEKNSSELLPVASMTKMMTQYLVLESIKEGRLSWDQKTSISDYVFKISQNRSLSNVPLRKDAQYNVKELFEAAAIYSANGAAIALAEMIGGSEGGFVEMMNDKAKELGMKEYKFVNSTGLNNSDLMGQHPSGTSPNDENLMSSRASALLAYRLVTDYPEVLKTSSIPKKTFREGTDDAIKMDNWNWMLPSLVFGYEGMDGLKTGSTDVAGYSFTGTAKRGNLRLITVIMKADSYQTRFSETKKLMDYGFSNYVKKQLFPAGYSIPGKEQISVAEGRAKTVEIETKKSLVTTIKRGQEKLVRPVYVLNKKKTAQTGSLRAPLQEGETIGFLTAKLPKEQGYFYLTQDGERKDGAALVTKAEVKKAGWFIKLFRGIGNFFSSTVKNLFG